MEKVGIISFVFFLMLSLIIASERNQLKLKSFSDWIIDVASLLMHFLIVPALQVLIVIGLLNWLAPEWKGIVPSPFLASLFFYLLIDYGWYWNHRILHSRTKLWNLHRTHHAPTQIDVFVTSRNLLITHFLMIYFWAIGFAVYVLQDPSIFLVFASIGMVLNFWGHTSFSIPCNHLFNKIISSVIVTPREHLWHHSRENSQCNYGTVINIWDRLHGTFYCKSEHPKEYGDVSYKKTVWNQLFWPF
jgi:sterol desaturase/sphingolipid hydroxylase (fatty acid hydroxylase superfamily)